LLPGDDVTLYDGKPWITIDGRVKLMRRNPDWDGHTLRPLKPDEKADWGYDKDDIVIECLVHLKGKKDPIQGYGRVRKAERFGTSDGQRQNPIAKIHPVELATKRALARAERFAFGTESYVDDDELEEAVRTVVSERAEHQAERAAKYVEIYGSDDMEPARRVDVKTGEVLESKVPLVTVDSILGQRYAELVEEAAKLELDYSDLEVSFPADREDVIRKGGKLRDRIDDAHRLGATEVS
jgi:hypothetical protein